MNPDRLYRYVGPAQLLDLVERHPAGRVIATVAELDAWVGASDEPLTQDGLTPATFVVDHGGGLRLAARGSEHVVCAAGRPVLAAGELFVRGAEVVEITNQSTGYCPEPGSWPSVARVLDQIGVVHPVGYTPAFTFRRCAQCWALTLVKDDWYVCAVCSSDLPSVWNCEPGAGPVPPGERLFEAGTSVRGQLDTIALALDLAVHGHEQDWGIELADWTRANAFIAFFNQHHNAGWDDWTVTEYVDLVLESAHEALSSEPVSCVPGIRDFVIRAIRMSPERADYWEAYRDDEEGDWPISDLIRELR